MGVRRGRWNDQRDTSTCIASVSRLEPANADLNKMDSVCGILISGNVRARFTIASISRLTSWSIIPLSILRVLALGPILRSADYTFTVVPAVVWAQLEMHLSLIASTIPCMRPFLRAFHTGYYTTDMSNSGLYGTHSRSSNKGSASASRILGESRGYGESYDMKPRKKKELEPPEDLGPLRPDVALDAFRVQVRPGKAKSQSRNGWSRELHFEDANSSTSDGSDRRIIRKTVGYSVH